MPPDFLNLGGIFFLGEHRRDVIDKRNEFYQKIFLTLSTGFNKKNYKLKIFSTE